MSVLADEIIASCLGVLVFHGLIQSAVSDAWDSETFVKDLDELKGLDLDLLERDKEDPQWASYINDIEPAYDEKGFPETTTTNPEDNFFAQKLNWSLTGRGEVPYLAVIYQLLDNEGEQDQGSMWGVVRHRACGGVLVSTDRLITNCLCVASYFASMIYQTPIAEEDQVPLYTDDLGWRTRGGKYQINGRLNRIYVQFGSNRYFTGKDMPGVKDPLKDMHLVDGREEHDKDVDLPKLTILQDCGKLVEEAWFHGSMPRRLPNGELPNQYKMKDTLALVPFWPDIRHPAPGQFVPWPPQPFSDLHTQYELSIKHKQLEQVIVTGIGFEKANESPCSKGWKLLDDDGIEIPLHKQAINLPYLHCINAKRDQETCRGKTTDEKYNKLSCFCDLYEPDAIGQHGCKTITGGVLGWPIIYQGNVVALTAAQRSLHEPGNRILGSSLAHKSFQDHVVLTLTKEKMLKQRTERPPMFREDVVQGENVVFYDYPEHTNWFTHLGTTPKLIPLGLSRAVPMDPFPIIYVLPPLLNVFIYRTSLHCR